MFMCKECGVEKTYEEMKKDKRDINGVSKVCKKCNNKHNRQLRSGERVRVRNTEAERASWPAGMKRCSGCMELLSVDEFGKHNITYDGLATKCRVCRKEYGKHHYNKWVRKNPEMRLWLSARSRAAQQSVPFTISVEDIVIPKVCPVLGIEIKTNEGKKGYYNAPSIDKFIPELGYTPENIQVISFRANWIKQNASLEEVEALAKWMRQTCGIIEQK
jgi:hypothetical protein